MRPYKHTSGIVRAGAVAALVVANLAVFACGGERRVEEESGGAIAKDWPTRAGRIKGVEATAVTAAIRTRLAGAKPAPIPGDKWEHVQRLYRRYENAPLWLTDDGFHEDRATALLRALADASTHALRLDAYNLDELVPAVAAVRQNKNPSAEQLAIADVLLTGAYVGLAEDLMTGQTDPKQVTEAWYISARHERLDSALVAALRLENVNEAIARMRPQDAEYDALRKKLVELRQVAAKGGWGTVPEGRALRRGQTDSPARIEALRARLAAEGIAVEAPRQDSAAARRAAKGTRGGAVFDAGLAAAVATFQARHGIAVDSSLGKETVDAMNVPALYRLGQVAANLERMRWLPRTLGERYVMVNVPAFRLEGYEGGRRTIEMKVIVGKEYDDRATPVFSDSMDHVVFRPYWNVTPKIQAEELEPKIAADPGFMARGNYEYWSDGGVQRIRQRPGPENSLGLVKFMFPNSFNIYLHDTPDDDLFEKDVRAFSHGCIRLEKPEEFAQWVLGWDASRVQQAMQSGGNNRTVRLPQKLPVYILYLTTFTRDGALYFGNDLYARDDALVRAVGPGAFPDATSVRALAALAELVD